MSNINYNKETYTRREKWYQKLTNYRWQVYTSLFDSLGKGNLLGLGCNEGSLTHKVAQKAGIKNTIGIDLDYNVLYQAHKKGILSIVGNLNRDFSLLDESIDVVSADQVIEHLINVDNFLKEVYRVLKPGGYAVISTENLSALHNIFAILLGKQAFSQMVSTRYHLGNNFSPHYKKEHRSAFPHIHVFTIQGLKDICSIYGFTIEKIRGIGWLPFFPFRLGKIFEKVDPMHAYFLAIKIKRPHIESPNKK